MRHHEIDQLVVRQFRIAEAELGIGRALLAQQRPDRDAHGGNQLDQLCAGRRRLENSMTTGSSPPWRTGEVFRACPKLGWIDVIVTG